MIQNLWFALWFFLPAGLANVTPILASRIPILKSMNTPLDFHKTYRSKRIFGDHKTWRGVICGVLVGLIVTILQMYVYKHNAWVRSISGTINYSGASILLLGMLLGFGALFGDAIESLAKRQLQVASGDSWFPFDQLDYVIGGILLSLIYVRLSLINYVWIVILWFALHMLFSYIGYVTKLKAKPI